MKKCDLCYPKKITHWYDFKSKYWLIFDCCACEVPMFVLKRHSMELTQEEIGEAKSLRKRYFPKTKWRTDQRRILDHCHWHLIKEEG